jgi:hypothetical protein
MLRLLPLKHVVERLGSKPARQSRISSGPCRASLFSLSPINHDFDNSPRCLLLSHRTFVILPDRLSMIAFARYHSECQLDYIFDCIC